MRSRSGRSAIVTYRFIERGGLGTLLPLLQPFGDDTAHVGGGHGEDVAALDIEAELFEFGVAQSSEAASEVVVAVGER